MQPAVVSLSYEANWFVGGKLLFLGVAGFVIKESLRVSAPGQGLYIKGVTAQIFVITVAILVLFWDV